MTIKKHYEIHRVAITISHEAFNKAIRYKAFNNGGDKFLTEDRKREMIDEQQKFIVALRSEMHENGAYKELSTYQNNKMTILPYPEDINQYILIFFDKEVDDNMLNLRVDLEKDLFYLEEVIDE